MLPTTKKLIYFASVVGLLALLFSLRLVFSGRTILSQSFSLGPINIHYYGVIMALAVGCGFYLAIKRTQKYQVSTKQAEDLLLWLMVSGFVGARLYHVFSSFSYYWIHPADIIKVWNGGLSIYGAVFGGLIVIWFFSKRYTLNAARLLDWLTPSLILGQIIGRFGNLFNYEAFGYPTNWPWKMFVPWQFRPENYAGFNFFHPWFLYEAIGNIIILMILIYISRVRTNWASGWLFFSYLLLYNVLRFGLEFLRIDSTFVYGFRLNALVSLIIAVVAGLALIKLKRNAQTT